MGQGVLADCGIWRMQSRGMTWPDQHFGKIMGSATWKVDSRGEPGGRA